jgi:hypothetical protein
MMEMKSQSETSEAEAFLSCHYHACLMSLVIVVEAIFGPHIITVEELKINM